MVNEYLKIYEKYDRKPNGLNSICEINVNAIHDEIQSLSTNGSLQGMVIVVKDNIDVKGLHTTAGSLALADNIALTDAEVIVNLKNAGAVILGKANMTEFANFMSDNMPGGYSSAGGQVISAYNKAENPWGSSTGSAVAVSACMCDAAIGTDSCGSVVLAAMQNGVCGYRPPMGVLSQKGIVPISFTVDTVGPIARDVKTLIRLYNGIKNDAKINIKNIQLQGKKIAVNRWMYDSIEDEEKEHVESVIKRFKDLGAYIYDITMEVNFCLRDIMLYEFKFGLDNYLAEANSKIKSIEDIVEFNEKNAEKTLLYGHSRLLFASQHTSGKMTEEAYLNAILEKQKIAEQVKQILEGYDACYMCMPMNNVSQLAGLGSVSVPDGLYKNGIPRGIFLTGIDEEQLLSIADAMEREMNTKYIKPRLLD